MSMERELSEIVNKELGPNSLRTAMNRAENERQQPPVVQKMPATPQASPVARISMQPLIRMAEAMQRVQRLAEDVERAADIAERQLRDIRNIL